MALLSLKVTALVSIAGVVQPGTVQVRSATVTVPGQIPLTIGSGLTLGTADGRYIAQGPATNTATIYQNAAGASNFNPNFGALPNIGGPFTLGISTAQIYADSGGGNIFQLACYVNNTGSRATVAVFGFGKGNHVWGANLIGYTQADNDTAIGVEVDFGILNLGNGAIAYGLVLAAKGGLDGASLPNAGPFIQMQASANAASKYGIRSHVSGSNQAVASTGTLWLNDGTQTHAVGLDWSATTFTDSAIKLSAGSAIKIGSSTLGPSRTDRLAKSLFDGIGWTFYNVPNPDSYGTGASTVLAASGTVYAVKLPLLQGDVVTNLSAFCSNVGTVTHCWFMLLDPNRNVLGVTADLTSLTATLISSALQDGNGNAAPYTISTDGDYYFAIVGVFTGAPSFRQVASFTGYTNLQPARSGNSTTGLTSGKPPCTTANGSQAAPFSGGIFTVHDTGGFPTSGTLNVAGVGSVAYTGTTGTTFTGCTGGTGTAANNAIVGLQVAAITANAAVVLAGGS